MNAKPGRSVVPDGITTMCIVVITIEWSGEQIVIITAFLSSLKLCSPQGKQDSRIFPSVIISTFLLISSAILFFPPWLNRIHLQVS